VETEELAQPAAPTRRSRLRPAVAVVVGLLLAYVVVAYVLLPVHWSRYEKRHPWLDEMPGVTHTKAGIPGDPLNVALVGSEEEVKQIMLAAQWHPADPLSLRSDLRIAADSVFKRAYDDAPVSNLFLFGRKEDLAFEQPVGPDPRQRHHVRFWKSEKIAWFKKGSGTVVRSTRPTFGRCPAVPATVPDPFLNHAEKIDPDGRPVWMGAVTFDERVGLSHTTGEITHHISPDVDAERDRLFEGLKATGDLVEVQPEDDFHKVRQGRNGGGDRWYTDGRLFLGVIRRP
jgi:hypothetical protein